MSPAPNTPPAPSPPTASPVTTHASRTHVQREATGDGRLRARVVMLEVEGDPAAVDAALAQFQELIHA